MTLPSSTPPPWNTTSVRRRIPFTARGLSASTPRALNLCTQHQIIARNTTVPIVLNIYGGTITVVAMFAAFIVAGQLGSGDPATVRKYLPFAFAGWLIALDVVLRLVLWRTVR